MAASSSASKKRSATVFSRDEIGVEQLQSLKEKFADGDLNEKEFVSLFREIIDSSLSETQLTELYVRVCFALATRAHCIVRLICVFRVVRIACAGSRRSMPTRMALSTGTSSQTYVRATMALLSVHRTERLAD